MYSGGNLHFSQRAGSWRAGHPERIGEWFTQTITVLRDTITVKVNDKQVVNWTQPADWNGGPEGPGRRITGPGTIALQAHDPKGTVLYKNIRIKPLD
jgi:3-keto-disaccharide hydrolase